MTNGSDLPSRPRWGIFSTAVFADPASLAADVLLYDRLILPTPTANDRSRWLSMGWVPDDIAGYLDELGEVAHAVTWDHRLREELGEGLKRLAHIGKESEALALGVTPMVIAMTAWDEVRQTSRVPPIPVAAFRSREEAQAIYAYSSAADAPELGLQRETAALFHRFIAMPLAEDGAERARAALSRAIELSRTKSYQEARRAMYDWEDGVVAQRWSVEDAIRELEQRTLEHDQLVKAHFRDAVHRFVRRVVAVASGAATGAVLGGPVGGFLGALSNEIVRKLGEKIGDKLADEGVSRLIEPGEATFPNPNRDPGAALSTAISALYRG